ncbi:hypothetical protein [Zhihengliuella halotolerans]|nr:hypothetical protein [Zhihengliuella halotolerans]
MRILLLECSPLLRRWPKSSKAWMDHLPTISQRHRFWSEVPQSRVDWAKTRRRGWPPEHFAIRKRHRSTDQVTLSVLAWTLGRLKGAFEASQSLTKSHATATEELSNDVQRIISHTLPLLNLLDESDEGVPSRDSIRAARGAGWPWNAVADVAEVFVALDQGGAEALARRLLRPDGFPESLFQLSVLGGVLVAAHELGAQLTSLRPIGHMTDGPVYQIQMPGQEPWDLWCEAARCWKAYGVEDHYRDMAAALTTSERAPFQARNIRPDIVLARPSDRALVFECKYPGESLDSGYVAHGMYQAAFYGHQLVPAFSEVAGYSIGPSELVPKHEERVVNGIVVGLTSPRSLRHLVARAMRTEQLGA